MKSLPLIEEDACARMDVSGGRYSISRSVRLDVFEPSLLPNSDLSNFNSGPVPNIPDGLNTAMDLKISKISDAMKLVLQNLGENAEREGLIKTPERFAKAMLFFTQGYGQDPAGILTDAIFHEAHRGLVLVKDIEFSSLCEHHLVPFIGKIHIGYLPNGRVVGLSKLARIAEVFARRLQVQERLTTDVANCLFNVMQPFGVAVVVEAAHQCMVMRGVQKSGATTTTTCMLGEFQTDHNAREDLWRALCHGGIRRC